MKKILFGPLLMIIAVSCSSVKTSYDYDKQVDFTKYKTYTFTEEAMKLPINELNRDRILKAIETEITAKGFTKTDSPDALIDVMVKTAQRTEAVANSIGGYGYGRYGFAGGMSSTTVSYNQYTDGTLFINLIDKGTEKIVWMGRGTKTLDENASADKREANINYAVKLIFYHYPPKGK